MKKQLVFILIVLLGKVNAQTISWANTGASTAWYTAANWSPSTASGAWTSGKLAQFNNNGSATTAGINMGTSFLSLGAIEVLSSRSRILTIGNSSGTTGTLTFNGMTVNGVTNTILTNASSFDLTLQNNETGTGKIMNITLANATENVINIDGSGGIVISSLIGSSAVGRLTKSGLGSGVLTLSTGNTYTGKTLILTGFINTSGESAFGANPGAFTSDQLTLNGGGIASTAGALNFSSNRGITLGASGGTFFTNGNNITLTNVVTGSGALNKTGTSTLILAAINTYTGATSVQSGTLQLNAANTFPDISALSLSASSTFDLKGFSETIGSLASAGTVTSSAAGTITLTLGGNNSNTSYSGIIQNGSATSVSLTKTGTGTFTISGANTYTGTTTITAGAIQLSNNERIANSSNLILNGGTLSSGATTGYSETLGTLNLNANSNIALGTGNHTITFSNSSAVSWAGSNLTITGWSGTAGSSGTAGKIVVGAGGLTAGQLAKISFSGYPGTAIIVGGEVVPQAVLCTAPSIQSSAISFSSIGTTSFDVNWTNGNGAGRVVKINSSNSFTTPSTGSNPSASLIWANAGEQVVFNGTGSGPITITGLSASTTYYIQVFEFCNPDRVYQSATATNNPNSQITNAAATPTLSASSLTSFGTQCINGTFGPNSFTITGSALTSANVLVNSISGFEFCTTAGGSYTSSLSLSQSGGAYSQTIYVRFIPTSAISYSGNISVSGGGASSISVPVIGIGENGTVSISNVSVTSITATSASSGGNSISTSCGTITSKGVVWSTSSNPTIPSVNSTNDGTGTSAFVSSLSGLSSNSIYHYRAYAVNSNGVVSYGTDLTFTTLKAEPSNSPTSFACGATTLTSIPLSWVDATGATLPDQYLIKWSTISYASIIDPIDLVAEGNTSTSQNIAQGVQSFSPTGLSNGTTYYFKIYPYTNSGSNVNYKLTSVQQTSCSTLSAPWEDFETGSKGAYATGNVTCTAGSWNMNDALIGTSASDRKNGIQSVRVQNSGIVSMNFDLSTGVGTVNIQHALYGSDGNSTWRLEASTTSGSTWTAYTSSAITTSSTTLTNQLFTLNLTGNVRFRIVKLSGGGNRISFDDIYVTPFNAVVSTSSIPTSFCAGNAVFNVPFTYSATGNFPNGVSLFTAQLSDATGSFSSVTNLQNVISNASGSQSISISIPGNIPTGSAYRIRVISANPSVAGSDNGSNISIYNSSTSIAPSTIQNLTPSSNGTTLNVNEGSTPSSRQWKYGTVSGGPYSTNLGTSSSQIPNFAIAGTYYIVCESTYGSPCSSTVRSNEVQINVAPLVPTLTTTSISGITTTVANSGGTISTDNGAAVTQRGCVWATSLNPTMPSANSTSDGSGIGSFSSSLSSLNPETNYHVRAYAINSVGTGYGADVSFYTFSLPVINQANLLIANAVNSSEIDLSWDAAVFPISGATVKGYVLLRASGANIPVLTSTNGQAPTGDVNTTIVSSSIAELTTTFSNTSLSSNTTYNYILIPYTWDGVNAATINYLTSGAPTSSATTPVASCTTPGSTPSSLNTGTPTSSQTTISWVNGSGTNRLVIASTTAITALPTNGIAYTASSTFGAGTNLGSFNYAVYANTGNSFTLSGLSSSTQYYIAVFEYNSIGNCYNTTPVLGSFTTAAASSIIETFEPGTKIAYANSNAVCNLGNWNFNDALIGTTANDHKNGLKSARIQNNGSITMLFNKTNGIGTITLFHAKYATDGNSTWRLDVSDNSGATFNAYSSAVITTSSTTLTSASFPINIPGNTMRVRITKLSGGGNRLNIDDIAITDYISGNTVTTGTITGSPYCISNTSGASISVPYTATGVFSTLNVFEAQLSNELGSFAIPTVIGNITSNALSGTISATIPAGTLNGTAYRIRVVASDPQIIGSQNGSNLSVILNAQDVSGFYATVASSTSLNLGWTNPGNCFDEILIVAKALSTTTVSPTGNGSLYTANSVFSTGGSGANLPASEYAIYKAAAGTSVTVTGLTAATIYYFEIFTRKGTNWSDGVIISAIPISAQVGDFRSVSSGDYSNNAIWQTWNGSTWVSATNYPNSAGTTPPTASVTIQSGHTVVLDASRTNQPIKNLTINNNARLWAQDSTYNGNVYLTVYGDISCIGTIGNAFNKYDNISFNIEGNPTTISGTGGFYASRIRKTFTTNLTTNLIIAMNVALKFNSGTGSSSGTELYSNVSGSTFNVTVNENSTLDLLVSIGTSGNISIDGIDGQGSGERGGTLTVNGTVNIPGTLFAFTDNITSPVNYFIGTSGIINCVNVCTANSATANVATGSRTGTCTLRILNGGKLNLTGGLASDLNTYNKPFSIRSNTTSPYTYTAGLGTTNNTFDFQAGSTVQYSSGSGTMPIQSQTLVYSNLLITGGATKTTNSLLTVNKDLTILSPAVLNPQNNQINIGGDWNNYNTIGFTEGTSGKVVFNGTAQQSITCATGENFYNVDITNSSSPGVVLNSNVTLGNDLDLGTNGRLTFGPSPVILTLAKMTASSNTFKGSLSAIVDMSSAEHLFTIGCEYPGYSGLFSSGTSSLVNYNRDNAISGSSGNQDVLTGIVYANLSVSGSDLKRTSNHFTVNKNFVVDGSATILQANTIGKKLTIGGNITLSGGATMDDSCRSNLSIETVGNTNQIFDAQSNMIKCFSFKSIKNAGSIVLTGPSGTTGMDIKTDFSLDYTGTGLFSDNANLIKVGDDVELGAASSTIANFNLTGTIELTGIGASTDIHISDYTGSSYSKAELNNLTINLGSLTGSLLQAEVMPIAGGQTTIIKNNLNIIQGANGAKLDANNNTVKIGGNWTSWNQSSFVQGISSTVEFNGTALQSLTCPGGIIFNNFSLNNTASIGLITNNNIQVVGTSSFTNGRLDLNGFTLTLGTSSSNGNVIGANSNSYVIMWDGADNGQIIHFVNSTGSTYKFPMGDLTDYSPFELTLTSGTLLNAQLTGGLKGLSHPQLGISSNYLNRYWSINQVGLTNPIYNVSYQYAAADVIGPDIALFPFKYDGAGWQSCTGSGSNAMVGTGSVNAVTKTLNWNSITTFSDFTGIGNGTPLPIELLSFTATPINEHVELQWSTASETNNDYFTVEKSSDAIHFEKVFDKSGAGNSSTIKSYADIDPNPFQGVSYYRLKQTDYDGEFEYSQIVPVSFNGNSSFQVLWSNYNAETGAINLTTTMENENLNFALYDLTGRLINESSIQTSSSSFAIFVGKLQAKGIYLLHISNGNKQIVLKLIN